MAVQLDENLFWILDGPLMANKGWDENENKKGISFVHALGLKCDSVGWTSLNLLDPNSDEILLKIKSFCDEHGWKARGYYSRGHHIADSQWYRLNGEPFRESERSDTMESVQYPNGEEHYLEQIKAYTLIGNKPRSLCYQQCVSEDFMKACVEKKLDGLRYCWLNDVGKYNGTQYFAIAPEARVPRMMYDNLRYEVYNTAQIKQLPIYSIIQKLGGKLPKVAQVFTNLEIILDGCYLQEDMPDTAFAYGYLETIGYFSGQNDILLRRDAVEVLMSCKVLTEHQISPVYITDSPIPGYCLKETIEKPFPNDDVLAHRMDAYRELVRKDRPQRSITERDALRILRIAKRQRKEDFHSAFPKKRRELLVGTPYAALEPYYSICEAGYLNDEYRLLSYDESLEASKEVAADLEKEETKDFAAEGIVIATCPDGDKVMLTASNEVIRISHEVPEIIGQWSSLACFFAEVIS